MNAKKCDRCGKYYQYYHDGYKNGFMVTGQSIIGSLWTNKHKDLCPDCLFDLLAWFNGGAYDGETKVL